MNDLFAQLQQALGDEYSLERETHDSAVANVFLARERIQNRSVLVSVLTAEAAGELDFDAFFTAAERTAALDHPGIVPPIALGAAAGRPYIVTPYVPGVTLRTRLAESPAMGLEEIVAVLRDVAVALEYAHANGALHGHVTPERILLSQKTARLLEFSVVRDLAASQRAGVAYTSATGANGSCLAPEQVTAGGVVDHRADLFAWGCAAYEMLTGVQAFVHSDARNAGATAAYEAPAPITLTRRDVPQTLLRLIMRCLSFDPADRPAAASNLVQVLQTVDVSERALAERTLTPAYVPAVTRQPTGAQSAPTPSSRPGARRVAVFAVGALAVIAIGAFALRGDDDAAPALGAALPPLPPPSIVERSIAVLPVVRTGAAPGGPDVLTALDDAIAHRLADAGVLVVGRISAASLRDRGMEPRQVGRELGAASVLTGTMSSSSDSVRLNLSLRSTDDGKEQWSAQYDRAATDIAALVDEVSREIAGRLRGGAIPATAAAITRTSMDPSAQVALRAGYRALYGLSVRGSADALRFFSDAVTHDSSAASAHAAVALAHAVAPMLGVPSVAQGSERASAAASRALAIDSGDAEAWLARALVQASRGANREAERSFRRALARDSTMALAWIGFAELANHVADYAAARQRLARARVLEHPASLITAHEALVALSEGKAERAEAMIRHTAASDSGLPIAAMVRAEALVAMGRGADALALMEATAARDGAPVSEVRALLAWAAASAGDSDRAREVMLAMRDASAGTLPPMATIAATLAVLGDVDSAVGVLARAADRGDPALALFNRCGRFRGLRQDVRGAAVLARVEGW